MIIETMIVEETKCMIEIKKNEQKKMIRLINGNDKKVDLY